ncbi:MAG TPA: hypothetical protein VGP92_13590 [Acidimicrobiia bacterium]|nr:hypothetical protein [Acidimicrobiia bacterium]
MNVPNITQRSGSVTALPRTVADGDTVSAGRAAPAAGGAPAAVSAAPNVSFARLAWFDLNGDGQIDPRSATAGGDATLLVPAHAIGMPTYARAAGPLAGAHATHASVADDQPVAANAAQTNRAVVAYQRYGQPAVDTPVQAAAPPAQVATPHATERAVA